MLNKILVLFLMWIAIGFVGNFWKAAAFNRKITRIDKNRSVELNCEAISMMSHRTINVDPDELKTKKGLKEFYTWLVKVYQYVIFELIKRWIFWPHTFAMLDQIYGEVYEQMLNKYEQPEKTDVPS